MWLTRSSSIRPSCRRVASAQPSRDSLICSSAPAFFQSLPLRVYKYKSAASGLAADRSKRISFCEIFSSSVIIGLFLTNFAIDKHYSTFFSWGQRNFEEVFRKIRSGRIRWPPTQNGAVPKAPRRFAWYTGIYSAGVVMTGAGSPSSSTLESLIRPLGQTSAHLPQLSHLV